MDNKHTWSSAQLCERGCICHQHWTWGQPFLDCRTLSSEPLQPSGSHLALEETPPVETVLVLRPLSFLFVFYTNNPQFVVFSPIDMRRHITDGVAKQAKTSSVLVRCVRCGRTMDWPRHWPHIKTWRRSEMIMLQDFFCLFFRIKNSRNQRNTRLCITLKDECYTCPLWVLAADVCVEWHAATSTTLPN